MVGAKLVSHRCAMQRDENGTTMPIGRRDLILAAGVVLATASVPARAQTAAAPEGPRASVPFDDGLAIPIPAKPSLGQGKDRALVLGGGGEYFAAWMLGFMQGLHENGVTYEMPEVIIGTSAGSVVGSTIAGGHLARVTREFEFFGAFPKLLAALVPTPKPNPSQLRAHELCNTATDASVATIQAIGRGAMAARNPSVGKLQDMVVTLTGNLHWPSEIFHATTVDCYSGQRLVVWSASNVHISHAVKHVAAGNIRTDVDRRPHLHGRRHGSEQHAFGPGGRRQACHRRIAHRRIARKRSALFQHAQFDPAGNQGSGSGRHQGAADRGQPG
ncbi:hypothetical protein GIW81_04705 [Hyphomicrobium sp. xq]|uniref:PNPLA domain-containing protein n=1 Tax=Hyphomicrobium album TaxID=2665159 RepID=A0A6I3KGY2_9HYPH|nr:hypothetical protein [Hyphomicrobium album]